MTIQRDVQRYDYGETRGASRTPQGGLRIPAALTRLGVLEYKRADGTTTRELRQADEVFAPGSLATLPGAPVVDLHPAEMVTAETWRALAVGHVHDDVRRDGEFLVATLTVQDATECARIEAGERRDVSCGYQCDVDPTPGVTADGERFDAVQRNVRYNHIGLGPKGWGRAGPQVALRMDGAVQVIAADAAREQSMSQKLKVGGKEYRCDSPDEMKGAQAAVDEVEKKDEIGTAEIADLKKTLTEALTKVAMLEAQLAAASAVTPPPAAPPPDASAAAASAPGDEMALDSVTIDRAAKRLLQARADAKTVLGEVPDLERKTAGELHRMIAAKGLPSVKLDGLSADVIGAMARDVAAKTQSAATTTNAPPTQQQQPPLPPHPSLEAVDAALTATGAGTRSDGNDDDDLAGAMRRNREQQSKDSRARRLSR